MKLKHRRHMNVSLPDKSHIIVYYSAGEIFLGVALVVLAIFFAYNYYLTHVLEVCQDAPSVSK